MRIYIDDDLASPHLAQPLQQAGHDVLLPVDGGLSGSRDASHFRHAIAEDRLVLTRNRGDFEALHDLVMQVRGHHPGIMIVCLENDRKRDMKNNDIVRAVGNLESSGIRLADEVHILNQWR
jgi:predicted nuclease of predicted toxin-antitoxin system